MLPHNCYDPIFVVEIDILSRENHTKMYFAEEEYEEIESTWSYWNKVHAASGYNNRIEVSLVLSPDRIEKEDFVTRWLGESIYMIILQSSCFKSNSNNYPVLDKFNQQVLRLFMQLCRPVVCIEPDDYEDIIVTHYKDYLQFKERLVPFDNHTPDQDSPRFPLQPLKDNLDYATYETFEQDPAKYIAYQRAIEEALKDMVSEEEKATKKIVVMIVGAGQGPLVRSALNASVRTKRKIKIVIVEKNPNAINVLEMMMRDMWKGKDVELIYGDMRKTQYEGAIDILVSELLGSFGDNELSPECLDGIQHFLKPTGISIPCNSISYLRPIATKRVNSNLVKFYDKVIK
jgi:protein arginine N-methyltransferase 5